MSGLELTIYLRKSLDSINRMIPIIMLTARNSRPDIQTARDAGITEYIVKPFTAKVLLERVFEVVKEPRPFIMCKSYTGPDRRRVNSFALPPDPDENHHYFERKPPLIVDKEALQQLILDDTPRMVMPDYALKKKVGFEVPEALMVNPLSLAKSEEEIQKAQDEFLSLMMQDVESLYNAYYALIRTPDNTKKLIQTIEDAAFSIKSRAGIFGYVRATEVAGQLYNFCKRYYDPDNANHLIILEKHIQTISAIFAQKITSDGGELGRQLIIDLARLINKYLNRKE
jgi:DNA-binding response OmpR family regulator